MSTVLSGFLFCTICSCVWGATIEIDQDFYDLDRVRFYGTVSAFVTGFGPHNYGRAQTFTVGKDGILDSIEVYVPSEYGTDFVDERAVPTALRILATESGSPIGGLNGSVVLAESSNVTSNGPHRMFDLRDQNLDVEIGDVLAIELLGVAGEIGTAGLWGGIHDTTDPYPGGRVFYYSDRSFDYQETWSTGEDSTLNLDVLFRTFVDTSLPKSNESDFLILGNNFGGNIVSVPEPSASWLLFFGLLAIRQATAVNRLETKQVV